ncbi:DUF485 domain-containing protein [Motilibacter aurantiacus]|uniref:DUF485 domain-containing protein n=1 Tax=Motilibacter aurantiacus TaxID=2714955 RepID=UPI00140A079C|nr:DUF485 domain-containing protein [Motilibacter aurantiacus]NHC45282.1 DUF485 domain-containing protein [Motilibacter aurantiacus]
MARSTTRGQAFGPQGRPPGSAEHYAALRDSPDFRELRARFRRFVFPMTAAFLAWYLLYVVCSAWARDFMGSKLVGVVNVAFVFGLLQFVSTFLIAWLYARHARSTLDPLADRVARDADARRTGRGEA